MSEYKITDEERDLAEQIDEVTPRELNTAIADVEDYLHSNERRREHKTFH